MSQPSRGCGGFTAVLVCGSGNGLSGLEVDQNIFSSGLICQQQATCFQVEKRCGKLSAVLCSCTREFPVVGQQYNNAHLLFSSCCSNTLAMLAGELCLRSLSVRLSV